MTDLRYLGSLSIRMQRLTFSNVYRYFSSYNHGLLVFLMMAQGTLSKGIFLCFKGLKSIYIPIYWVTYELNCTITTYI